MSLLEGNATAHFEPTVAADGMSRRIWKRPPKSSVWLFFQSTEKYVPPSPLHEVLLRLGQVLLRKRAIDSSQLISFIGINIPLFR